MTKSWGVPFIRPISKLLGIEWEVRGKDAIADMDVPCIILCNHQSILDFLGKTFFISVK